MGTLPTFSEVFQGGTSQREKAQKVQPGLSGGEKEAFAELHMGKKLSRDFLKGQGHACVPDRGCHYCKGRVREKANSLG